MPFDISEFRSSFFDNAPQKPNLFEVLITPPAGIIQEVGSLTDQSISNLRFRIFGAGIPGKNLLTTEWNTNTVQAPIKIPFSSQFDELQLQIMITETGLERILMGTWMNYVHPTNVYRMETRYFDNIVGQIQILVYGVDGSLTSTVDVQNCYPTAIGSVELEWNRVNLTASFRVAFTYETMNITDSFQDSGDMDTDDISEVAADTLFQSDDQSSGTATDGQNPVPSIPSDSNPISVPTGG